uniref:Uncharacterized protein n=1 Tax=Kalanchoe fedtschenkoi TaxID=63787 RepID=A0A7N0V3Y9_KALFE
MTDFGQWCRSWGFSDNGLQDDDIYGGLDKGDEVEDAQKGNKISIVMRTSEA